MAKFFRYPFADSGLKISVPDSATVDGSVSYQEGFTADYKLDQSIDPSAKDVPLEQTNEILYDATNAIRQYQTYGLPDFITTSDNGGSPYPYEINAQVRYDDGGGFKNYISLVDVNTFLPTDTLRWREINSSQYITYVEVRDSTYVYGNDVGAVNSIVINPSQPYVNYTDGTKIEFLAANTNTGATTINISGLGAKSIKLQSPLGLKNLGAHSIVSGVIYKAIYDGTQFQIENTSTNEILFASIYLNGVQLLQGNNIGVPILYNMVEEDQNGWVSLANNRIIPKIPGRYRVDVRQYFTNYSDPGTSFNIRIVAVKNGIIAARLNQTGSTLLSDQTLSGSFDIDVNGTTDYLQVYAYLNSTGNTIEINQTTDVASDFTVTYIGS
jgi:hypothetical protein